jgi:flagellum-specific peptidoglycan hydrolase FlgJ
VIVAATVTPFLPSELIEALRQAWLSQLGGIASHESLAVIAAQVALETANGRKCIRWNVGNFKAYPGVDTCTFETVEYVNGAPQSVTCSFAAFDSLQSGCEALIHTLYTHWPNAWHQVIAGQPGAYAEALGNQRPPYFTAPVQSYARGCASWFAFYMAKLGGDPSPTEPELSIEWAMPDL